MAKLSKIAAAAAANSALSAVRIEAQAAIVSQIAQATPTHVIASKAASKVETFVPFTDMEVGIFDACIAVEKHLHKSDNIRAKLIGVIADQLRAVLGESMPSFDAWKYIRTAIILKAQEGFYKPDTVRKHLTDAMVVAYGDLPVSVSASATKKAAQRAAKKTIKPADVKAAAAEGFNAGREHALSHDTIESFIARVGIVETMAALNRILDADESTTQAAAILKQATALVRKQA